MWGWLAYPTTPPMPRGAMPLVSRLALSHADGLHVWESVFRFGVDSGRTEGAMVASACWLGLILLALLASLMRPNRTR